MSIALRECVRGLLKLTTLLNMKKTLLGLIASLLVAVGAQANTYTDNNSADVWLNANNTSYTGTFTLAGYNSAAETITSAQATFTFWDSLAFGGSESFSVNMGGDGFSHGSFYWDLSIGQAVISGLSILDSTGALSYTITRTSGEFWLTNASLTATTAARNVPDAGATSILLGLGVLAMVGAKRRLSSIA